jgi:hypothetical protein
MTVWEVDLHRTPLQDPNGKPLWELLICDRPFDFTYGATVPQADLSGDWLQGQFKQAIAKAPVVPKFLGVFRPAALSLITVAAQAVNLAVTPTRHTPTLKQWLTQRSRWYPSQSNFSGEAIDLLALDRPAPVPVPETLWGERWQFAAIAAQDFQERLCQEPIPLRDVPEPWLPLQAGLASTAPIPGVIIDGGRRTMALAQWLQTQQPVALNYIAGDPDGLILEAGLVERWVLATVSDPEVQQAARVFGNRKQESRRLHFLLLRPDDSGMTYTGLWLLRD